MRQQITTFRYICDKCKHQWIPRRHDNPPKICPRCKSKRWDVNNAIETVTTDGVEYETTTEHLGV